MQTAKTAEKHVWNGVTVKQENKNTNKTTVKN
jgi:hypothetical protein